MYHVDNLVNRDAAAAGRDRSAWHRVSRNVWSLGLTSLLTDVSSEMVTSVLPLYLVVHLGLTPLTFGIVDGLYQGLAAILRVAGGVVADRWRRHKEVAALGYGLSAMSRLGLLAAGSSWPALASVVALDRAAKGIRTAPRDALISLSSSREDLGLSFGVHRAMDAAGAMLGPVVAFVLLSRMPNAFDRVFVWSFSVAVVGLAVLLLFVHNVPAAALGREAAPSFRGTARLLGRPAFRRLSIAGTLLAVATISDGFIYLALQRQLGFEGTFFPLLYVATAFFYFVFSAPFGRLADRVGRSRVFAAGYALLAVVYGFVLAGSSSYAVAAVCLVLFGAYYAATDGVLMALASGMLSPAQRGSGLALLATMTNAGRLLASVIFGVIWTAAGLRAAVSLYAAGLLVATIAAAVLLRHDGGEER
jgi:MFS family permease